MTFEERVAQCLLDARELMNSGGRHWIKGWLRKKNGKGEACYCSIGAIRAAAPGEENRRVRAAAKKILAAQLPGYPHKDENKIIGWNDDPRRKWSDVSKTFRQAAKRALQAQKKVAA